MSHSTDEGALAEAYQAWAACEACIEAPKVRFQEDPRGISGRGLYATDTIYPRERILYLPRTATIGADDFLKVTGTRQLIELNKQQLSSTSADAASRLDSYKPSDWERFAIARVEQFRRKAPTPWRGDDSLALYLACCLFILQRWGMDEITIPAKDDEAKLQTINQDTSENTSAPLTEAHPLDADIIPESNIDKDGQATPGVHPHKYPSFLPHVSMLPKSFPTCALYFSSTDLSRIDGTNCKGFAMHMAEQIESDWRTLHESMVAFHASRESWTNICPNCSKETTPEPDCWCQQIRLDEIVTLETYKWALVNIYSRAIDFEVGESLSRKRVMAPLFDMLNHSPDSDITHSMDTKGNVSVFNGTTKTITAGEEIFLNYGNIPNEKLLLIYGFTVPNNPFDAVSIYAPLNPSDPLYSVKARILEAKAGISDTNQPYQLHAFRALQGLPTLTSALLSALRVTGITSAEGVLALASQGNSDDNEVGLISIENEQRALSALQEALYTMSRRIALNLINDDNLTAASATAAQPSSTTEPNSSDLKNEQSNFEALKALNAKTLCESEYAILQTALGELAERLEALDSGGGESQ